ncbi:D-dopachrome decarboxylase [Eurytemora carolleeae]|uniref:D-dopachrome decarboxylase n=1 Tax=Eurytemora carolleeae TaxID=1294199 RepID=UPI000C763C16|nr:D-dopachrome decarboxylase [Eurytemora carolleeae]|eukprot:XP_023327646.1 D-dopachrome decarboxylase-like [Eurytemora affinis]
MPFVTLLTNLKLAALPKDIMPRLITHLSPLLNKPAQNFNWVCETEKNMSKGPEVSDAPMYWLKIESIGSFEDPKTSNTITPEIFKFFTDELKINQDNIVMTFYNLRTSDVAKSGNTVEVLSRI